MTKLEQVQEFVRKYDAEVQPLPIDPVALLMAWDKQRNYLTTFVEEVSSDTLDSERDDPDEGYYTHALGAYWADRSDKALSRAAEILEDNVRQSYLDDGMLRDVCYEVVQGIEAPVIPDDEP